MRRVRLDSYIFNYIGHIIMRDMWCDGDYIHLPLSEFNKKRYDTTESGQCPAKGWFILL